MNKELESIIRIWEADLKSEEQLVKQSDAKWRATSEQHHYESFLLHQLKVSIIKTFLADLYQLNKKI